MYGEKDTKPGYAEVKAGLALHLGEGLLRELIARGLMTEAALTRILDSAGEAVPPLFNNEEVRQAYDKLRARLEGSFPTNLERADRDRMPDTED